MITMASRMSAMARAVFDRHARPTGDGLAGEGERG